MHRRQFLIVAGGGLTSLAWAPHLTAAANAPPQRLRFAPSPSNQQLRQAVLKIESAGDLKLNAAGQQVERRPLQVSATFTFDETTTSEGIVVRHYSDAQALLRVGKSKFQTRLRDERRVIAAHRAEEHVTLYSPLGPLSRDELELLQSPGNNIRPAELLSDEEVAVGESWTLDAGVLARLLWLDAVSSSQVTATLENVTDGIALVTFTGPVGGAVGGIATDIDLQGKLNYDLQQSQVTWLTLGIQEKRSIGHAEPGFETSTQVKLALRPQKSSAELAPAALKALPLRFDPAQALLAYESTEGRFRALLDRRWRVMVDRADLTVLRLIDRGDLIAQCNLSRLPALAPGKQLPLEELQDDIKQSLGKNFRQFAEASQSQTDEELRILRVTAVGEASDLAVQWNYYHLSNEQGQRLALVFTFESNLAERFAEADRALVASLEFLADPAPTTAPGGEGRTADTPSPPAASSTSSLKSPQPPTKR